MPAQMKRPGDVTGRETERLVRENAEKLKAREGEISLFNAQQAVIDSEPIDLTGGRGGLPEVQDVQQVDDGAVTVASPVNKRMRVNTTLENVTIGVDNVFEKFEEGREYYVPAHVYDHLEEKGYVWH